MKKKLKQEVQPRLELRTSEPQNCKNLVWTLPSVCTRFSGIRKEPGKEPLQ